MTLFWEGVDQGKVARSGIETTDDPIAVIRTFWPHGWRRLVIRDERGHVVGVIGKRKGRRCWTAWRTSDPEPQTDCERFRAPIGGGYYCADCRAEYRFHSNEAKLHATTVARRA